MGFSVVLASLLEHAKFTSPPNVHILYRTLSERSIGGIQSTFGESCNINLVRVDERQLLGLPCPSHLSIEAYFRLLLPRLLPERIEKVLYLDCDLIITDCISHLMNIDLGDKLIGICPHWNSGVMLINLARWRKTDFGERLINYVRENPELCPMADNSAILALVQRNDAVIFDLRWNISHEVGAGHKGVIHSVGALKPWHIDYPYRHHQDLFFRTLDTTHWRGWRPQPPSRLRVYVVRLSKLVRKAPIIRSIRKGRLLSALQKRISS